MTSAVSPHIDLFSGIGGFSLGLERCGFRTVAFCEADELCQDILRRRWPGVAIYGDIRDDCGLPLPGSFGGGQAGRPQRLSELVDVRPDWLVIENVYHTWRRWVPELRGHLWRLGYASVCLRVRASEIGARHDRARAFVVAHADGERLRELSRWWIGPGGQVAKKLAGSWDSAPRRLGTDDGLSDWTHRRRMLGNAVCPPAVELVGRAIRSVA